MGRNTLPTVVGSEEGAMLWIIVSDLSLRYSDLSQRYSDLSPRYSDLSPSDSDLSLVTEVQ